ncbi:MAG TPA: hypothetical protein DHW34_01050 [Actinobacteria bacterium]|nr:hypothetical protein [Actinomycetota bacterium]
MTNGGVMPSPRVLASAAGLGALGCVVAVAFLWLAESLQHLIFRELPAALGAPNVVPVWLIIAASLVGALLVSGAQRLPGRTGPGPLSGFHLDIGVDRIASVLLAALATICCGFALGPEAPLMAAGTAAASLLFAGARRRTSHGEPVEGAAAEPAEGAAGDSTSPSPEKGQQQRAAMALSGFGAIGTIFSNPLISVFIALELAVVGQLPTVLVIPAFVALTSSFLVQQILVRSLDLQVVSLSLPGLPTYSAVTAMDLLWAAIAALAASLCIVGTRSLGHRVARWAHGSALSALLVTAVVTSAAVLLVRAVIDGPIDLVLFSGQSGLAPMLALTSVGALLLVLAAKALVHALALGSGFRGGPIFPAVFLGATTGAVVAQLAGASVTPLAVAAVAAGCTCALRLPLSSALLAALIAASAGATVAAPAAIGAVMGLIVVRMMDLSQASQTDTPHAATPAGRK